MRQALSLIPLFLPFVAYGVYVAIMRRRAAAGADVTSWEKAPWVWLAIAGVALMLATLLILALVGGGGTDSIYIPPRLEDGKIVPPELR